MDKEPVDSVAPWGIKAVSTATRNKVIKAARKEGLTVGQWLERRVDEWEADGSPVPVSQPHSSFTPSATLAEIAHAIEAVRGLAQEANVAIPPQMAKEGVAMVRKAIREARGLAPKRRVLVSSPTFRDEASGSDPVSNEGEPERHTG